MEKNNQKKTDNLQFEMNSNSNPGQPIRNIDEKPLIQTGPALNNQISQNINQAFENNQNPQNNVIPLNNLNQEIAENIQLKIII